jgi:AraC-like DNA-binding protein
LTTDSVQLDFQAEIAEGEPRAGAPVFQVAIHRASKDVRAFVELHQCGERDPGSVGRHQIDRLPELGGFITYTRELVLPTSFGVAPFERSRLLLWGPSVHSREAISDATQLLATALVPGGVFALAGIPPEALAGGPIELDQIWGSAARTLAARLEAAPDRLTQSVLLEAAIRERLRGLRPDMHARAVVDFIARADGDLRVAELASRIGYSERQLRRVLGKWIGLGPKAVRRVIRLQHALRVATAEPDADWASAAATAGYHDQSHFSEECREMTGSPPQRLLAGVTAPALVGQWGILVRRRDNFLE